MGKASIHIQKASGGAITHNSRENYSKSVVFIDEVNELLNDKKQAYEIYRSELKKRVEAYTNRTNQKLQKKAVTHLSAVVNLEQHHTLKDLESIKDELEKVFDTKVFQIAIHRDEGKIKHKETGDYFVSGIDFFYNPDDKKYYEKKDKHTFSNEINIDEYDIEKNYHAHIELMGLDSQGNAIRQKMNRYVLSNLQDFTAIALNMERGNNYQIKKSAKRLDTHEFKASKKRENEVKKIVKNEKNKIVKQANEIIKNHKEDKKKLKEELEELKKENAKFREELKNKDGGVTREEFKLLEDLNKQLQADLKASKIDLATALEQIEELKKDIFHPNHKTDAGRTLTNKEVADYFEHITIPELQKENKSLKEQNKVLEDKLSTLEDKVVSSANMSDYELLKKENEELKKENSFLKRVIDKVLTYANSKIKELVRFGKPQVKQSVEFEDFKKEVEKEDNHKSTLSGLESLNKTLEDFVKPNQKKEDLDYSEYHNNLLQR